MLVLIWEIPLGVRSLEETRPGKPYIGTNRILRGCKSSTIIDVISCGASEFDKAGRHRKAGRRVHENTRYLLMVLNPARHRVRSRPVRDPGAGLLIKELTRTDPVTQRDHCDTKKTLAWSSSSQCFAWTMNFLLT